MACSARRTPAAGGRMSPSRTRCRQSRRGRCSTSWRQDFRPRPLGIPGLALHRYLGGPWETLATYGRFAGLADVADPVAADIERGEAGFEHRGEHRHVHQLFDAIAVVAGGSLLPSLRPNRPAHRFPGRPRRTPAARPAGPRPDPRATAISSSSTLVLIESSRTDSVSSPSSSTFSGASPPS